MKLSEIAKIPSDSSQIKKSKPIVSNIDLLGKIENRDIFGGIIDNSNEGYYLEHRDESGATIGFLLYQKIHLHGKEYALIHRTWVDDKYQRQGFMSGLILFIRKHQHLTIMSDGEQTPEAQNFWKSLISKKHVVKVLNIVSNEITPVEDFGIENVYSTTNEPTDYRLIMEKRDWSRGVKTEEMDIMFPNRYYIDGDNI